MICICSSSKTRIFHICLSSKIVHGLHLFIIQNANFPHLFIIQNSLWSASFHYPKRGFSTSFHHPKLPIVRICSLFKTAIFQNFQLPTSIYHPKQTIAGICSSSKTDHCQHLSNIEDCPSPASGFHPKFSIICKCPSFTVFHCLPYSLPFALRTLFSYFSQASITSCV